MNAADPTISFGLGELPAELILAILSHLVPTRGLESSSDVEDARRQSNKLFLRTLHALTLTCRRLSTLANPLLYQTFIQPVTDAWRTRSFFNTIKANPNLAAHVQYIENLCSPESYSAKIGSRHLGMVSWEDAQAILNRASWPPAVLSRIGGHREWVQSWKSWYTEEARQEYTSEQDTMLLIILCRNLVSVALYEPTWSLFALQAKEYARPSGLRHLWITSPGGRYSSMSNIMIRGTALSMALPVSDCVWLHRLNSPMGEERAIDTFRPAPQVAEVVLDMCEISPTDIAQMLAACTRLKRFTCRWGITEPDMTHLVQPDPPPIDLPLLRRALFDHHETLERLIVDTLDSGWMVSMSDQIPAIGSLREFESLKYLAVSGLVLWGDDPGIDDDEDEHQPLLLADILPPNLEDLVIRTEWEDDVELSLAALPEECPRSLPKLKLIDCSWRPAPEGVLKELPERFSLHGIQLRLAS
ncbi:hypothetical protein EJ04DRAFT_567117 [Polyplosphaeria fusca]|uniref:Leucine-rich repeat domain-containing protein n=1 Tax=Polyplosphaeria fusca TaxID=682080 RepID=A0A9P4QUC7_9PLEO|nr:hypothetical protein EJ04DRAFT_567117 [Polyplosphaeria fusca]